MSSAAQSARRAAPANLKEWGIVFRSAGRTTIRSLALIVAVIVFALVRGNASIQFQLGGVGVSLICLWIALGSGARAWVFYVVGFILFAQLRAHADEIGTPVQFSYPIDAEKALFLGHIPTIDLQNSLYSYARMSVLEGYCIGVYLSYFFAPHVAALALWKWDRGRFRIYVPAFLITVYVGLVACAIVPTAPPWMASEAGMIPRVYQVVRDITQHLSPGAYQAGENSAGTNTVASMPSLHAAVPYLMAIALWKYKRVRWIGVLYAASMSFAIVYLGEHYFVDAIAGFVTAAAAWWAGVRLVAWWDNRAEGSGAPEKGAAEPSLEPVSAMAVNRTGNTR